jgi:hypothetical protein
MSLEDLSYEEVKTRAIHLAEKRHDVGFFYDLFRHTPAMNAAQSEGGSLGDFSGSIIEMVDAARGVRRRQRRHGATVPCPIRAVSPSAVRATPGLSVRGCGAAVRTTRISAPSNVSVPMDWPCSAVT